MNMKIKRLLLMANLVLAGGLLYFLTTPLPISEADVSESEVFALNENVLLEEVETSTVRLAGPAREDYEALIASDIFGVDRVAMMEPDEDEEPEEIVDYMLPDMRLTGTIAGGSSTARAFIKMDGEDRVFRIGDTVSGVTLDRISPRSVSFVRDGRVYDIAMDFKGPAGDERDTSRRERPRMSAETVVIVREGGEVGGEESERDAREVPRGRWGDMDEEERQRRLEAMRERRERMLEEADPETRERIMERIRRAEEQRRERR